MKKEFYEKRWFLILTAIIFPPAAIALLWIVKKDMKEPIKIILTVLLVFWGLILLIAGSPTEDTTTQTGAEITTEEIHTQVTTTENVSTTEETTEETTEVTTEETTVETTREITTEETKPVYTQAETERPVETEPETTEKVVVETEDPDESITVYRTATGSKYHYENPCGNGTYYPISLADAERQGLEPCGKCVL